MLFYPLNTVCRERVSTPALTPNVFIVIAVDVAYLVGQEGIAISDGIYMMDNMVTKHSSGEGSMQLSTVGNVGWLVGWQAVPVATNAAELKQSVVITGFQVCDGNVFGQAGFPLQQPGASGWIGQLMYAGTQTYQIQVKVTAGALRPVSYVINWNATIIAQ
ncbi:MAG TPA: hypothetical protein VK826_05960 [Bacteroidia bacterium]|nr:hypothetical protein [Bacteroidia bacterium]